MKVIEVVHSFPPYSTGGVEIYVENLVKNLRQDGVEALISLPIDGPPKTYFHDGIKVRTFPAAIPKKSDDITKLYDDGDEAASEEFFRIVDSEKPDIVHLHSFNRSISLRLVREIKKKNIPVIFTCHGAPAICPRCTLMKWGRKVCDGRLAPSICASCVLQARGLPAPIARVFGFVPYWASNVLAIFRLSGGLWTALRLRQLIRRRQNTFCAFMREVDSIVTVSEWGKKILSLNGVPANKIKFSRPGIHRNFLHNDGEAGKNVLPGNKIRIVFLGRIECGKGPDIVIKAMRLLLRAPIEFHIYGIEQHDENSLKYLAELKSLASRDPRIALMPAVPNEEITPFLKQYHLLVMPSRASEGAPIAILEAFAAGIPVIGSNLLGISELIEDEVNGLLVKCDSIKAWKNALERVCKDNALLARMKKGVVKPRSSEDVAREMKSLYLSLVKDKPSSI